MKKILYINGSYKTGSTGQIIESIVSDESASDIEYKVLFQQGNNEDEHSYKFENKLENIIRRFSYKFFGRVEWSVVSETSKIIDEIKKFSPDIIHLHILHHQCTNYTMLFRFLKEYKVPVVITVHDCWIYTGGCYHYTEFGCDKFKSGCENCTRPRIDLDCDANKAAQKLNVKCDFYNNCDFVYLVGVSQWICDEIKASKVTNKNIICIRNGVDTKTFEPLKDNEEVLKIREDLLKSRKHLVLGVANIWSEKKGLSGFKRLAKELGEDYQVVLVGGNLPKSSDIDNLVYYGRTNGTAELAKIYNAADILVNMSIEESFGLVTAEAACCNTPVIAYDSTANSEVINMAEGVLIPRDCEKEMFEEVKNLCSASVKDRDIEKIRAALSKKRMTKEYISLYNDILNKTNNEERR